MEIVSIALIIVLLVLVNRLSGKVDRIEKILSDAQKRKRSSETSDQIQQSTTQPPVTQSTSNTSLEQPSSTPAKPREPETRKETISEHRTPKAVVHASKQPAVKTPIKKDKPKPQKPSFMERNPDLEKFIGENLLSKIGIVIFVIGMGFLVKLGIDNQIITESMRVAIGIIIGGGMIGLAHYLRNSFSNFSSILIGGALAVLYFTIGLAFHEYSLIPQGAAFVIMILITAFGVLLSIAYDRVALAVLAIIGGFGTPFFISTGTGDFTVLLTYIMILDIGMLSLVYFKKWNIINYLCYGFTYVLFIGVFWTEFSYTENTTWFSLLLFLTAFYLIFFLMTIIYNVKNKRKFKYPEIIMMLSNSAIFFGLGLALIGSYKQGFYSGIFTAFIAVLNFGFTFFLFKRKDIDKNLLFILIGLVLTFVSLIAPIQLNGNYITVFWACEAVLLLWLAQKSEIKLMKATSLLIAALMLISLAMDWVKGYEQMESMVLNLFLNKIFITSCMVIASLIGLILLLKKDEIIEIKGVQFVWKSIYIKAVLAVVVYLTFLLELNYQFVRFEFQDSLRVILLGIYNYTFVILILGLSRLRPGELLKYVSLGLSGLAVISYLTGYLHHIVLSRGYELFRSGVSTGYYWHYIMLVLFIIILTHVYIEIQKNYSFKSAIGQTSLWAIAFISLYVISAEASHVSVLYQINTGVDEGTAFNIALKSVFPVVWTLTALMLMIAGMKFRLKTLRIASLGIFCITVIKLFFYDLAGNSTGKIISFIFLGLILLAISFLYQKLKFIIQDDENKD